MKDNKEKMTLKDWILAMLYAFGGKAPSKEHLELALFIASKHIKELEEKLKTK
jgi:hypothetical protein